MSMQKLSREDTVQLLEILRKRFEKNMHRHKDLQWSKIEARLETNPEKLWSLNAMEETGGEPDVIAYDTKNDAYVFYDCSPESPKGRRSICYDQEALDSRKQNKPKNSAMGMASEMGIELLNESQYRDLQKTGKFDAKTSSWVLTPTTIRALGGAIYGDWRYGQVFIYHNGAESYYAARGFRGWLKV
ncbi:MAG: DUF4256 domain-containing protein [Bacteroidales bacterium]|nr:DUF4256 domain-containing protein [Bacteroidales bacterium]